MAAMKNWRSGVTVVRGTSLAEATRGPAGGRATAFDFSGSGGKTWIGAVTNAPGAITGTHNHGRHEVALYIVKGRVEIRWGERLEYLAEMGPGDFAYFEPHVPHQERNLSDTETVDFVVVRSDSERIVVKMDDAPVEKPEAVY
jgi:uncharacterized RmlC-like cupin family protein